MAKIDSFTKRCVFMFRLNASISSYNLISFGKQFHARGPNTANARLPKVSCLNCQVENEDVVGAAPKGDAPTTFEWSKIYCLLRTYLYQRFDGNYIQGFSWIRKPYQWKHHNGWSKGAKRRENSCTHHFDELSLEWSHMSIMASQITGNCLFNSFFTVKSE